MDSTPTKLKQILKDSDKIVSEFLPTLSVDERKALEALKYRWSLQAREQQLEPYGDWVHWLLLGGRGSGKTRTGAETIRKWAEQRRFPVIHLIAPTAADVRDTMVEGSAGILAVSPSWFYPKYEPSKCRLTWPNGVIALTYSAEEPDRLRGPQCYALWADELCAWKHPETWDMAMFGLRLGPCPRAIITTTPKPTKLLKTIFEDTSTVVTRMTTYDNLENLAPTFHTSIIGRYEGTRLGRQEINAEILTDNPSALWKRGDIDNYRTITTPQLDMVVVGIDPAVTSKQDSDETGIVVAGRGLLNGEQHYYVLNDATVEQARPEQWANAAITEYHKLHANLIVAEGNNGGEMVAYTISTIDETIPVKIVHASRGKAVRAEPVAALSSQGRLHHVGAFPQLEDQLCEWTSLEKQYSPDRMDALVWAITALMPERQNHDAGDSFGAALL